MDKIRQAIEIHQNSVPSTSIRVDRTVDTVSGTGEIYEADVYVAYRQYAKAKSVLSKALEREPHRSDLKLKLLNILFITRDVDGYMELFQEAATELKSSFPEGWKKAIQMAANMAPDRLVLVLDSLEEESSSRDSVILEEPPANKARPEAVHTSRGFVKPQTGTESSVDHNAISNKQYVPKELLDAWDLNDRSDQAAMTLGTDLPEPSAIYSRQQSKTAIGSAEGQQQPPGRKWSSGRLMTGSLLGLVALGALLFTLDLHHAEPDGKASLLTESDKKLLSPSNQSFKASAANIEAISKSEPNANGILGSNENQRLSGKGSEKVVKQESSKVVKQESSKLVEHASERVGDKADDRTVSPSSSSAENADLATAKSLDIIQSTSVAKAENRPDSSLATSGVVTDQTDTHGVSQLLAEAESYRQRKWLTTPKGQNAYATYQLVLELDPANDAAVQGISAIGDDYEGLARQALLRGDVSQSGAFIYRGLTVTPEHMGLLKLQKELETPLLAVTMNSQRTEDAGVSNQLLDEIRKMQLQIDELFSRGASDANEVRQRDEYIEQLVSQVEQLLEKRKTREALRLVQSGLRVMPEHPRLIGQQENIKKIIAQRKEGSREATRFVDGLVAQARQHREKGELEEAMQLIQVGLRLMQNHRPLLDLRELLIRDLNQANS